MSLPYTFEKAGFMKVMFQNSTANSSAYLYLKSSILNNYIFMSSDCGDGGYRMHHFPVQAGDTITVSDSRNVMSVKYWAIY